MKSKLPLLLVLGTALATPWVAGLAKDRTPTPSAETGVRGVKSATPSRIAFGAEVNLADYAVPGKTTIFDFTSKYCPPCVALAPKLHQLHAQRADVAVVEVDVNRPGVSGIDWGSPLVRQFGLESIPAFQVYGPDRKLKAKEDDARGMVYGLLQ